MIDVSCVQFSIPLPQPGDLSFMSFHYFARFACLLIFLFFVLYSPNVLAQSSGKSVYDQIKPFLLNGGKADVSGLILKRDRGIMTFTGTFYFTAPIEGKVTGAVFIGQGTFKAAVPPDDFEKANVKRLLGVENAIESDFKTAVFRFSDDTIDFIGGNKGDGATPNDAQTLANEVDNRILKETGANLSSRVALSILNHESPGFFFANFDGGRLGRFSYLLDYQNRILTDYFGLDAGEKGIIFRHDFSLYENDVWTAFFTLSNYARRTVSYSDQFDLVDITNYDLNLDLRNPGKRLGLQAKIQMHVKIPNLRAVTFTIGESLSEYDSERLKKQMRVKSVRMGSTTLDAVQEDWEGGITVFLPNGIKQEQTIELEISLEGDFMFKPDDNYFPTCIYPISNTSWYPKHGYRDRSTYAFTFTHSKVQKVASTGTRISEQPDPADKGLVITKYVMNYPVTFQTFAIGPWERHQEIIKWENGDQSIPLEFNSPSSNVMELKEQFILNEMNNSIRFFQKRFGKYPYDSYSAVFFPSVFGQGLASMLVIPSPSRNSLGDNQLDRFGKHVAYDFIPHETAHQWWGNIVLWRSYRDAWLSEGFAEYSGVVYAGARVNPKEAADLIDTMRRSLIQPPETGTGLGKGKLVDVGPLILGHRLETRNTRRAYTTLVYNKGALVLRMIHFLLTDPSNGNEQPFYDMLKDFVERYRNGVASTDDFRRLANEHFAKTAIAMKFGLKDLDWFFQQWVYDTTLPSYKLDYQFQAQPDGSIIATGNVIQENSPNTFFMPLPVMFKYPNGQVAHAIVAALGPKTPFQIRLDSKPDKMELDPQRWVLSERTSTK